MANIDISTSGTYSDANFIKADTIQRLTQNLYISNPNSYPDVGEQTVIFLGLSSALLIVRNMSIYTLCFFALFYFLSIIAGSTQIVPALIGFAAFLILLLIKPGMKRSFLPYSVYYTLELSKDKVKFKDVDSGNLIDMQFEELSKIIVKKDWLLDRVSFYGKSSPKPKGEFLLYHHDEAIFVVEIFQRWLSKTPFHKETKELESAI